jgi:MoCo/4Fe-4S cofactor protein with predicted Tat translocation signal
MPSLERSDSTRKYWRSLNELEQTPEFQELVKEEFPAGPEQEWTEPSRRRFLQLMGASLALGTASSCRWQKEYITPMVDRPEGWVPGTPRHYASMMQVGGVAQPLVVTSYDGRPTKVEGNKLHPSSQGATSIHAQAATLELCDPDRSQTPMQRVDGVEQESSMEDFAGFVQDHLRGQLGSGQGLAVLAPSSSSPAFTALRARFMETYPQARFVEWEAWSRIEEQQGLQGIFNANIRPIYKLAAADIVLSLDEDLLGTHPDQLRHARDFASRRRPEDRTMNRLYSVEPSFTLTGAAADHRLPLCGAQVTGLLLAVQKELADKHGIGQGGAPAAAPTSGVFAEEQVTKFVTAVAGDLAAHRGSGLVVAGPTQPAGVHAAAAALNAALGNRGQTVEYHVADGAPAADPSELAALVSAMNDGQVDTLVCLGTNPVYDAPADLDFAAAYAKVTNKIHHGLYRDETAVQSDWHLNAAHWLESWGDALAWDGTYTIAQPLIAPLYNGQDACGFLGMLIGRGEIEAQSWIRQQFGAAFGPDEMTWRTAVQRGFQPGTSFSRSSETAVIAAAPNFDSASASVWKKGDPLEAVFRVDSTLYDGRYANLGWLQELPDPMTKLTWDNAAVIGPATAQALGVKDFDLVEFAVDGRSIQMAVYVMPGQAPGTVGMSLGYGRTECGHVAGLNADDIDPVGFNTYTLRGSAGLAFAACTVGATAGYYKLASTQDHHTIDAIGLAGRADRLGDLVRGGTLEEWRDHPDFAQHQVHHPPLKSLWEEHEYEGYRWGMAIDLSTCTGCSACTIACQSENNIPIVGKDEVFKGREMNWIRMDRYFTGDEENPEVQQQPVGCQHCENAPCEQVCPVAATVHSSEGLNDMVYNRCIGTRYCSNNCPYKVRRFNFLNWNKDLAQDGAEVRKVSMNPDVTVRVRGVMEKCSYCVQRIAAARTERNLNGERIQDGDIVTACQQVCPSEAIHFGDLNDEGSVIRKKHANDRAYAMLAELNNKPRTAYLAAIRNPHPDLAPALAVDGHSDHEEEQHG